MIDATCGKCDRKFQVDDKYAGMLVRCRDCRFTVKVPHPHVDAMTPFEKWVVSQINREPTRATNPYRTVLGVMIGLSAWAFLGGFMGSLLGRDGGLYGHVTATGSWVAIAVCVAGLAASHGGR